MVIIDASALIALLNEEPGSEIVAEHISEATISAINLGEVAQYHLRSFSNLEAFKAVMTALELEVLSVDDQQAYEAARIRTASIQRGKKGSQLSQADTICLAAAKLNDWTILTADKEWKTIADKEGIAIKLIR